MPIDLSNIWANLSDSPIFFVFRVNWYMIPKKKRREIFVCVEKKSYICRVILKQFFKNDKNEQKEIY